MSSRRSGRPPNRVKRTASQGMNPNMTRRSSPSEAVLPDGGATLYRDFFPTDRADKLFTSLSGSVAWTQERIKLFGKSIPVPRLTAWYGDAGATYSYSGLTVE